MKKSRVRLKIVKNYRDTQLERRVLKGEQIEVDVDRAKLLSGMGLAQVLEVSKLKSRKNVKKTIRNKAG